jgi:hypothetical protein
MAGILDSKERVQDFILTKRGRQQLSEGRLQLSYATFTDLHTFYEGTEGVVDDASSRLFLEAFQRQQDQIVPPALADGRLLAYGVGSLKVIDGGRILSGTAGELANGEAAFQQLTSLVTSNLLANRPLGEIDEFAQPRAFSTSPKRISFEAGLFSQFSFTDESRNRSIREYLPLLSDPRFDDVVNFAYLPPEGLLPAEVPTSDRVDFIQRQFPDPKSFRSRVTAESSPVVLTKELLTVLRNRLNFEPREIEVDSPSKSPDLIIQAFTKESVGGSTELQVAKLVSKFLGVDSESGRAYWALGKILKSGNSGISADTTSLRFVDAAILIADK